jgi:competence ComEA-like helix-hairpin-helix protein
MSIIKDFFSFNKRERSGIITLFVLIICSITLITIIDNYFYNTYQPSFKNFSEKIQNYKSINEELNSRIKINTKPFKPDSVYVFKFNPNTADSTELYTLGFNKKQVKNLINYRNKGGFFKKPEDLKKLWGMTDSLYLQLYPYIVIPETSPIKKITTQNPKTNFEKYEHKTENKKLLTININTADTSELIKLKGIGSILAQRIINFREKAGGFYSVEQLKHIYGLKPEVYNEIQDKIYTDGYYKKININQCTAEELKKHPYINSWNIANAIVNYRKKHGPYLSSDEIKKTDLVNDELYSKLAPYLVTQ